MVVFLLVALLGRTVATNCCDSPTFIVAWNWEFLHSTPVTGTSALVTVTWQEAFLPPSFVVTVMVVDPTFTAVTFPSESTVAMDLSADFQVTDLSEALDGWTEAVSCWLSPTFKLRLSALRETPVTGTMTLTRQVAVLPPSWVVTVIVV